MRELQQAVERLSQENQLLRQGQAGISALAENLGRLATSLQRGDRKLLIDTKGIGRPEVFSNDDSHFRRWARSVVNLTTAIFGSSFQSILEWVVDQDEEITVERVEEEHGGELGMAGLDDKGDQLFRLLSSLTTHESEDLVINAKNGYEAWRRLNRRWDPLTAGRKRNILRAILNPERVKSWEAVRPAMEQLDDLMRRYEARRNERGERDVLSQDIKCTSLELLVPTDIERHLILNKNRLGTYEEMKQEIEVLIETVAGAKGKVHRPGSSGASGSGAPLRWTWTPSRRCSTRWSKARKVRKEAKVRERTKVEAKAKAKETVRTAREKAKAVVQAAQDPQEHASTVVRPAIERPSVGARRRVEKVPKAQGSLAPNRSMWQESRTPTTKLETKKNNRRPKWECLSWVHSPRESPRKTQAGFGSTLIRGLLRLLFQWIGKTASPLRKELR